MVWFESLHLPGNKCSTINMDHSGPVARLLLQVIICDIFISNNVDSASV